MNFKKSRLLNKKITDEESMKKCRIQGAEDRKRQMTEGDNWHNPVNYL
jgi:hypothetical protein